MAAVESQINKLEPRRSPRRKSLCRLVVVMVDDYAPSLGALNAFSIRRRRRSSSRRGRRTRGGGRLEALYVLAFC